MDEKNMEKEVLKNENYPNKRVEIIKAQYDTRLVKDAEQWYCQMKCYDDAVMTDKPVIEGNYVQVIDSDEGLNLIKKDFTSKDFERIIADLLDFFWGYEEKTLAEFKSINDEVATLPQMFVAKGCGMKINFSKDLEYRISPASINLGYMPSYKPPMTLAYTKCFESEINGELKKAILVTELELENIKIKDLLDAGDDSEKIEGLLGDGNVKALREAFPKDKGGRTIGAPMFVKSDKNIYFKDMDKDIVFRLIQSIPNFYRMFQDPRKKPKFEFVVSEDNTWIIKDTEDDKEYRL